MMNSFSKICCPRKRILVAEDNKMHSELLRIIIQSSFDAEVVIAENGREALDKIAEHGLFDLIIIDIMIPEVNGLDILKSFRKVYDKIPVLMLSALSDKDTVEKSFGLGATGYISKPIIKDLLKERIGYLLKN